MQNASLQIPFQISHACHRFWNYYKTVILLTFDKVHNPSRLPRETASERPKEACTFSTSQLPKVLRECCASYILTSKCATGAPNMRCSVFCILTWKRASRHTGVQFFTSHLPRWLRTRRFSKPTFQPSGATKHWKNRVFRDFSTFSRTWIFFLLTLSLSSSLLFSSLTLPTSAFSSVHIVGSLTKLPSVKFLFSYRPQRLIKYLASNRPGILRPFVKRRRCKTVRKRCMSCMIEKDATLCRLKDLQNLWDLRCSDLSSILRQRICQEFVCGGLLVTSSLKRSGWKRWQWFRAS